MQKYCDKKSSLNRYKKLEKSDYCVILKIRNVYLKICVPVEKKCSADKIRESSKNCNVRSLF